VEEKSKQLLSTARENLAKARNMLVDEVDQYLVEVDAMLDDLKELDG
jgi:hypothetical protein